MSSEKVFPIIVINFSIFWQIDQGFMVTDLKYRKLTQILIVKNPINSQLIEHLSNAITERSNIRQRPGAIDTVVCSELHNILHNIVLPIIHHLLIAITDRDTIGTVTSLDTEATQFISYSSHSDLDPSQQQKVLRGQAIGDIIARSTHNLPIIPRALFDGACGQKDEKQAHHASVIH
jgi:hypothetical protein